LFLVAEDESKRSHAAGGRVHFKVPGSRDVEASTVRGHVVTATSWLSGTLAELLGCKTYNCTVPAPCKIRIDEFL
jgi:hypothetical protein